jgi:hypothetical protein
MRDEKPPDSKGIFISNGNPQDATEQAFGTTHLRQKVSIGILR